MRVMLKVFIKMILRYSKFLDIPLEGSYDNDISVEQFQNLWEAAYKAVESCFKEDLPEEFIKV